MELTRGSDCQVVPSFRPSGSEAVTRCHLSGKENGRFPNAVGFTSSATCLLKLGGKGTRLEIKVRRLGVRTGFLTQEGFDGYIWGTFRQFAIISNLRRCFTPTQVGNVHFIGRSMCPPQVSKPAELPRNRLFPVRWGLAMPREPDAVEAQSQCRMSKASSN